LSGAGYALFESLQIAAGGQDWALLVTARIGAAVIHILTTGLTGWGLVSAWKEGRYARLVGAFLTAVTLHGLWNGLSLASSFPALMEGQSQELWVGILDRLSIIAPLAFILISLGGVIVILLSNRAMKSTL
jgi:hypothetical protein